MSGPYWNSETGHYETGEERERNFSHLKERDKRIAELEEELKREKQQNEKLRKALKNSNDIACELQHQVGVLLNKQKDLEVNKEFSHCVVCNCDRTKPVGSPTCICTKLWGERTIPDINT